MSPTLDTQRKVAIIGAGLIGASAALVFHNAGFDVILWSDKTREQLRDHTPPTGTAVLFGASRDVDTHIIEDLYPSAPQSSGIAVHIVSGDPGNTSTLAKFDAQFAYAAQAIDVRLRTDNRIERFVQSGGNFQIRTIDTDELDLIAAHTDLTLIATGKSGLTDIFESDSSRSHYHEPQRYLLTLAAKGLGFGPDVFSVRSASGGAHNIFSVHPDIGEFWWGPYLHKDIGPSWSFVGFARRGSELETAFREVSSAQTALSTVQNFHRKYFPEISDDLDKLTTISSDQYSWLQGTVNPIVKKPYAYTKNGHLVAAIGDSAIAFDPIAGQGAQVGINQVVHLADTARKYYGKFDEQWISDQFEQHWLCRAHASVEVTRAFLSDPVYEHFHSRIFAEATEHPAVATALFQLLSEPQRILSIHDTHDTERFIDESLKMFSECKNCGTGDDTLASLPSPLSLL